MHIFRLANSTSLENLFYYITKKITPMKADLLSKQKDVSTNKNGKTSVYELPHTLKYLSLFYSRKKTFYFKNLNFI